ncbi:MAG TPA: TlpA disulfide reductase family protein [Vicinamibacteria bacterium]|nr:TlpA disulfide reductase family protein [Vicinamibacteria bacterium]
MRRSIRACPALLVVLAGDAPAAEPTSPSEAEVRVVEYLKSNVKPGERVVVTRLYNEVFTDSAERGVLDRLFDTFFKLPLFLAQHQQAAGKPPTLADISGQFGLRVPGQADVLLRIMESDPRMPKFITRDPASGEITSIDVEGVLAHPHFGRTLARTIAGWEGRPAPAFSVTRYDGMPAGSSDLVGRPYLLYFWFTNCPPCVRTSPMLAELGRAYADMGFTIVGLNADRVLELPYDDAQRLAHAREHRLSFTLAHLNSEMHEAYGSVSVFPTMFFVDARGTIVKHIVNEQERPALEAAIRLALH